MGVPSAGCCLIVPSCCQSRRLKGIAGAPHAVSGEAKSLMSHSPLVQGDGMERFWSQPAVPNTMLRAGSRRVACWRGAAQEAGAEGNGIEASGQHHCTDSVLGMDPEWWVGRPQPWQAATLWKPFSGEKLNCVCQSPSCGSCWSRG